MTEKDFQSRIDKYFDICEKDPDIVKAQKVMDKIDNVTASDVKSIRKAMQTCLRMYSLVFSDVLSDSVDDLFDDCNCDDCKCVKTKSKKRSK